MDYSAHNIQLRRNVAVLYRQPLNPGGGKGDRQPGDVRDKNLARSKEDYNGYLSEGAKRNIKKCIESLIQGKKYYQAQRKQSQKPNHCFTFVTLTLSDHQGNFSDNDVKRLMLGWFLTRMRDQYQLKNYLWKAEKQDNGNIHFHILMDLAIQWRKIRDLWNKIQDHYGFLNKYQAKIKAKYPEGKFVFDSSWKKRNGQVKPVKEQLRYFLDQRKRKFKDANSTDIHSLKGIKDVASYVTKEFVSKKQAGVGGRLWGKSTGLENCAYYTEEVEFSDYRDFFEDLIYGGKVLWHNDFAKVVALPDLPEGLRCRMEAHYAQFLN